MNFADLVPLLWAPVTAALLLALCTGPLGATIVWRRMAFFGDTVAHSALLGVALGLWLNLPVQYAVIAISLLVAGLLATLQQRPALASDTLLGIIAQGALASGLCAVTLADSNSINLMHYLFGDLLAVQPRQLQLLVPLLLGILALTLYFWRDFLLVTLHEDLARIEGIAVFRSKLLLTLMLACLIALAMQITGLLLISALLIIPAAAARPLSHTPAAMALLAALLGVIAVIGGIALSWFADTPAGASIVVAACLLFILTHLKPHSP